MTKKKFKKLRFLPLAFIVGVEGFVLVAPYLLFFLAMILVLRTYQARTVTIAA
jgi:hypothetical protein